MSLGELLYIRLQARGACEGWKCFKVVEVSRALKVLGAWGVGITESGANKINEKLIKTNTTTTTTNTNTYLRFKAKGGRLK